MNGLVLSYRIPDDYKILEEHGVTFHDITEYLDWIIEETDKKVASNKASKGTLVSLAYWINRVTQVRLEYFGTFLGKRLESLEKIHALIVKK